MSREQGAGSRASFTPSAANINNCNLTDRPIMLVCRLGKIVDGVHCGDDGEQTGVYVAEHITAESKSEIEYE